ncbi:MAG: response regulator transcription factor [Spirulinaceae cyanobacterium]
MLSYQQPDLRILVVDDHELTRFSLKLALARQKNIQLVGLASNGEEAIALVKAHFPDVVVLDLQMPVMDGFSASVQIKKIKPSTQIVAYSSCEEQQLEKVNKHNCIDAFCRKDANTETLIEIVKQLGQKGHGKKPA